MLPLEGTRFHQITYFCFELMQFHSVYVLLTQHCEIQIINVMLHETRQESLKVGLVVTQRE